MANAKFTLDPEGVARLLSAPEADAFLTAAGTEVAREWERLDPRQKAGGHEPPKIEVGSPERKNGVASVPVFTTDGIWHIIEYGSANNQPYRPATRAVQNSGLKFVDGK